MTELTGTMRLVRLAVRRDRVRLPVWLAVLTLLNYVTAASTVGLYASEADRVKFAVASTKSPVVLAFNGLVTGPSLGEVVASQDLLPLLVGAALVSTFAVVRHTRQNEETGRAEMIGSAIVGRYALLAAAVLVAIGANLVLGAVTALVLVASGLPVAGSVASGAAVALVGIAFAALAALLAQLPESARAANGLAAAAVGVAFLLRAVGDVTGSVTDNETNVHSGFLSWLSPIGWGQQIRPYDDNAWWVLVLPVLFAVACAAGAAAILARRDLGAGLMPSHPGPGAASRGLLGPVGLAWRLQRGSFYGWAAGLAVVSATYGAIGNQIDDFLSSSQEVSDYVSEFGGGSGSLTDGYFAYTFAFLGLAVAGYVVQALLRTRSEETGPLENVLATAVSRPRWLASHVTVAVLGAVALLLLCGLATGLSYALVIGDLGQATSLIEAGLVQLPATLVVAGLAVAIFGLFPRLAVALTWGALVGFLLLGLVGGFLQLPQVVLDLSPFSHVPAIPAVGLTALPLVALFAVAVVLGWVGFSAFRRRDIAL